MDRNLLPTCRYHEDRIADEACVRCGTPVCQTCTTYRNEIPICPGCLSRETPLMREIEHEAHIQAIGLLDWAVAGAFLFAAGGLWWQGYPPLPFASCAGAAALLLALGAGLRRYRRPAAILQAGLSLALLLSPVLLRDLRDLGLYLSLAFVGGFSLWALLEERGRECFTPYYREAVASTPEEPAPSVFLVLAMVLAAVEAGLRLVFFR